MPAGPVFCAGIEGSAFVKAAVELLEGVAFEAISDSGHRIVIDGAPEHGGQNLGPRPMALVLMGMGGCTAFDVVHILRRMRENIAGCRVELDAQRAEEPPRVFTRIHVHYIVSGQGLKSDAVARAVQLTTDKYCSASIMLGKTAEITHDFEIIESSTAAGAA